MMRRSLAVAALLVIAACGGTDDDDRDDAASTTTTSTTIAGETTTSTAASGSTAPSAGDSPTPTSERTATASSLGARAGQYRYIVEGTATGGTPPTTQPHRGTSSLTVSPGSGSDQRFALRSEQGQGTDTLLRYSGDGDVHIVELDLYGQLEKQFRPDQPVLAIKADPQAGDTWSWEMTSTDGTTTMRDASEVVGREQVTVAGRTVDALKIRHDIRITTTFNGAPITATVDTTTWHALDLALVVKDHTVVDVPGLIHDESTSTLESLDPA